MMGRDAVTLFGAAGCGGIHRHVRPRQRRNVRDAVFRHRRGPGSLAASEFDSEPAPAVSGRGDLGYRMQLPYAIGIDVAGIHRVYKDMYARIDINGFYPSGPNQPFGGFGKVDPDRGIVYPADQQFLEPVELHRARNDRHQEPDSRVPVHGGHQPAVAAHQRRLESDRSGPVHPAERVPERQAAVHAAREQRGQQPADRAPARPFTPTVRHGRSTG